MTTRTSTVTLAGGGFVSFTDDLLALQRALAPRLSPVPPAVDARGRFWRVGTIDDVAIDVVDPGFDAGVAATCYVADHGATVVVVDAANPGVAAAVADRLDEARAHRTFWREQARFRRRLPALLLDPVVAGRWVVFLDDEVRHVAERRDDAHDWAHRALGPRAGFVIAEVVPPRAAWVGGAQRRSP